MALTAIQLTPAKAEEDITPDLPNTYAAEMASRWQLADALMGGSEAMREAGDALLPQHTNESKVTYDARQSRSFLFPAFAQAVGNLTDIVFSEPLNWADNLPADLEESLSHIDAEGNSIDDFAKRVLSLAIAKGEVYVIADEPPLEAPVEGVAPTLADRARQKIRPYLAIIAADNMLAYETETRSGVERPIYARWVETFNRQIAGGFSEEFVQRVIEWTPGVWTKYEKVDDAKWTSTTGPLNVKVGGLAILPIVRFRLGNVDSQKRLLPPLHGLAEKNVEHWQSASDQRAILTVSRFPMLGGSGINADALAPGAEGIAIGPNVTLFSSEPNAKFYYVEPTGASINAGTADLERLEKDMATLAFQPLMRQQSGVTATSDALGQNKANSSLAAWSMALGRALDNAVALLSVWLKREPVVTAFAPNVEFGIETLDPVRVKALQDMRTAGDLSRPAFIAEMKIERVLSEDFDVEANDEQLNSEGPPPATVVTNAPGPVDPNAPEIIP